jgi:hypothetical protein
VIDPSGDGFDFGTMMGLDELKEKEAQEEREREEKEKEREEKERELNNSMGFSEQEGQLNENADSKAIADSQAQVATTFQPGQKENKAPPINYAKIAKSIDVSLLKEGIWRSICYNPNEPNVFLFPSLISLSL